MPLFFTKKVYTDVHNISVLDNFYTPDPTGFVISDTLSDLGIFITRFGRFYFDFIRPSLPGWPLWPGLRWLRIMCDWNDRWQARLWCYGFSDDDPSFIQNHLRSLFHTSFVSFDTGLHLASFDAVYYSSERIGYLALGTPASQRVEITRRVDDIITYGELFFDEPI